MAEPSGQIVPCPRCVLLERRIEELEARVRQLEALLLEATRAAKRQAAPFSRNQPKAEPKKPGRPCGHAPAHRPAPPPEAITQTIETPLANACPNCGAVLEDHQTHEQTVSDLPKIEPVVTKYISHSGWCPCCRQRVRSKHPDQPSTAGGAASHQLGPNALALGADLKHRLGLSYQKTVELFQSHFGLTTCAGALARAGQRIAHLADQTYQSLITIVRHSPVVCGDETGWRIGGLPAWLWVFTNKLVTVYTIREGRGHHVIVDVLGSDFGGVLSSDCCPSYDPIAAGDKQKCLGHIIKDLSTLEAIKTRAAVRFPREALSILRDAIDLKRRIEGMSDHGYAVARGRIESRTDRMLSRIYTDPDNRRLAHRMIKHREHLFTFLYVDEVEPTNNAAERAIRPAVIARKLSAGNRSPTGAQTHSILASLAATARQHGSTLVHAVLDLLRQRDPNYVTPLLFNPAIP
jgi:transposase